MLAIALWIAFASAAAGRQDDTFVRLPLRITSTGPSAIVDRGTRDGVAVGDLVVLFPHQGGTIRAVIRQPNERSATLELKRDVAMPPVGTRGEVLVPRARLEPATVPAPVEPDSTESAPPEHPPWENSDEEWTGEQPLLAQVGTVRPEERATILTGRLYLISDYTHTINSERSDSFSRVGLDLRYSNPFDRGGELHLDGELNYRTVLVEDENDLYDGHSRLDRLSYTLGGDRFLEDRRQFGRFLSYGMPEFGVIDGYEYTRETSRGEKLGWSIGFMPEPDADAESFRDLQISAHYLWDVADFKHFSIESGYQKTFHQGTADRDLFVFKVRHQPAEGWDIYGTAWVDLYTSNDDFKDSGLELTQTFLTAARRFESGNGYDLTYTLLRFPELLRNEFTKVATTQLTDDETDRLSLDGWYHLDLDRRLSGRVSAWRDEDESGSEFEVGLDVQDFVLDRSLATAAMFLNHSRFADSYGTRLAWRRDLDAGHWSVHGELARNRQEGFSNNFDDLPIVRGRLTRGFRTISGWDVELYAEGTTWDQDHAWSIGLFGQRTF
jgi:hypothetical protein